MPDRLVRDEMLRSHRYVTLSSDTLRLLFVHLILSADALGNAEATTTALGLMMARPVDEATAAKWLSELADVDLVRVYEAEGKRYIHIPRFRQRLRYLAGKHPRPPAAIECNEIKEILAKVRPQSSRGPTTVARSEEKRREEKLLRRTLIAFDASARKFRGITAEDVAGWRSAYPGVDVVAELRKAVEWIIANPAKAPRKNFARFIVSWLGRATPTKTANDAMFGGQKVF